MRSIVYLDVSGVGQKWSKRNALQDTVLSQQRVIWDVDQDAVPSRHYELLAQAVNEHGISLIALHDSIKEPVIQELLGLRWSRKYYHSDDAPYRIVEPNWTQVYIDELGESHDLVSNGKGRRRGIEEGVVEVQSHGWTHTSPHLEAYWAGDLSYRLHPHWGSEIYDRMRNVEIPGAVQLFAMKRSIEALVQQWNRRPLYLVAGQNAESHSYPNHTPRLAKKAGFAMMRDYWLGLAAPLF